MMVSVRRLAPWRGNEMQIVSSLELDCDISLSYPTWGRVGLLISQSNCGLLTTRNSFHDVKHGRRLAIYSARLIILAGLLDGDLSSPCHKDLSAFPCVNGG